EQRHGDQPGHRPLPACLRVVALEGDASRLPRRRAIDRLLFAHSVTSVFLLSTGRKGLLRRSRPIVVAPPCPGRTTVSAANGSSTVRSEVASASGSPPGRSVRPIDPANNVSPVKAR